MISQLSGTLLEATPSLAVVDVSGIGFELGISSITAASLPAPGGSSGLIRRKASNSGRFCISGSSGKHGAYPARRDPGGTRCPLRRDRAGRGAGAAPVSARALPGPKGPGGLSCPFLPRYI